MKKFIFCLIFLVVSSFASKIFCQEKSELQKLSFNASITTAYSSEKYEYSLIDVTGKENSRLEWEADYLFKLGVNGALKYGGLEFWVNALFPLPLDCGKMYDSDWRTEGIKTNLSIHDLAVKFGCDARLGIKYNFELGAGNKAVTVSPILVISNSYISLAGQKGIGWGGDIAHTGLARDYSWDSEYAVKVKKFGIDFTSNATSALLGGEVSKIYRNIFVRAGILSSPYTFILSVDHHLNKEEGNYYQLAQQAFFRVWDFYTAAGFFVNSKNVLLFTTDFSFCPTTPGNFYVGYYKIENNLVEETSRFSFSKFSLNLSWQIAF